MVDRLRKRYWSFLAGLGLSVLLASSCLADELYSYGYTPTTDEERAAIPVAPLYRAYLPAAVDLSEHFPVPGDQGKLNSCVGWAVGYASRGYYASKIEGLNIGKRRNIPSPSFIYHAIRGDDHCERGSKIPDALRLLEDNGSLSMADFPYSTSCKKLGSRQLADASAFKIDYWQLVNHRTIDDVKGQLARGNPVIFGMIVGRRFERLRGKNVYGGEDKRDGFHAMTAIGYDDSRQALRVINSWGTKWGNNGYGWISYDAFLLGVKEAYVMSVLGGETQC